MNDVHSCLKLIYYSYICVKYTIQNKHMQNSTEIINLLRISLPLIQQKYPVSRFAVFGSVARGDNTEKSDVDIMVELNGPIGWEFVDLALELEKLLGTKVDLVSKNGIKPRYFEHIKKDLIYV